MKDEKKKIDRMSSVARLCLEGGAGMFPRTPRFTRQTDCQKEFQPFGGGGEAGLFPRPRVRATLKKIVVVRMFVCLFV